MDYTYVNYTVKSAVDKLTPEEKRTLINLSKAICDDSLVLHKTPENYQWSQHDPIFDLDNVNNDTQVYYEDHHDEFFVIGNLTEALESMDTTAQVSLALAMLYDTFAMYFEESWANRVSRYSSQHYTGSEETIAFMYFMETIAKWEIMHTGDYHEFFNGVGIYTYTLLSPDDKIPFSITEFKENYSVYRAALLFLRHYEFGCGDCFLLVPELEGLYTNNDPDYFHWDYDRGTTNFIHQDEPFAIDDLEINDLNQVELRESDELYEFSEYNDYKGEIKLWEYENEFFVIPVTKTFLIIDTNGMYKPVWLAHQGKVYRIKASSRAEIY